MAAGERRGPGTWRRWAAALGGLALAAVVAAGWDLHALAQHAAARPHNFHGARCASPTGGDYLAGGGAVAAATTPGVGLSAWTAFQAGPRLNLTLPSGAKPLAVAWRFPTHGSLVTAPTVVDGIAYVGSMDGCVYAVQLATGKLLWSFAAANQVMSEPLVVGGRVYFGAGNKEMIRSADGEVLRGTPPNGIYALSARTGREIWMFPTPGEDMPTPAYHDGVVYEATGDKTFYAVDAATGHLLWKLSVGSYVSMSSPAIVGDMAVFGGAAPYALFGVDLQTHRLAWRLALPQAKGGVDDVSPSASGGVVFVQIPQGSVVPRIVEMAVRASDGKVLWQRSLGTDPLNVLQRALWQGDLRAHDGEEAGLTSVVDGVLYVGSPALPELWALRAATGKPVWPHPARLGMDVRSAPLVTRGAVIVANTRWLEVLDRRTGAVRKRVPLGVRTLTSGIMIPCASPGPELVGHTLLVATGTNATVLTAMPLQRLGLAAG